MLTMAPAWMRLAELAEKNQRNGIVYETRPSRHRGRPEAGVSRGSEPSHGA